MQGISVYPKARMSGVMRVMVKMGFISLIMNGISGRDWLNTIINSICKYYISEYLYIINYFYF